MLTFHYGGDKYGWGASLWHRDYAPTSFEGSMYEIEIPIPDAEIERILRALPGGAANIRKRPQPSALPDSTQPDALAEPGLDAEKPIVE